MKKEIDYLGRKVIITDNINDIADINMPFIGDYNKTIAQAQKDNCGYYIIDSETKTIIDDENELSEIYSIIKKDIS